MATMPGVHEHVGQVDMDGSGPLQPVRVICQVSEDGGILTLVDHDNLQRTKVDGFDEKGSFYQVIHYEVPHNVLDTLIGRSSSCSQSLTYECN